MEILKKFLILLDEFTYKSDDITIFNGFIGLIDNENI